MFVKNMAIVVTTSKNISRFCDDTRGGKYAIACINNTYPVRLVVWQAGPRCS